MNTERQRVMNLVRVQNRRARLMNAKGVITYEEWVRVLDRADHHCAHCGIRTEGGLAMDHVKALSRGGAHLVSNVVPSCDICNLRRGARD